ncbi:hypothetical protein FKM82_021524 [Ascaphus truei]
MTSQILRWLHSCQEHLHCCIVDCKLCSSYCTYIFISPHIPRSKRVMSALKIHEPVQFYFSIWTMLRVSKHCSFLLGFLESSCNSK